jgi:hypothetical protein
MTQPGAIALRRRMAALMAPLGLLAPGVAAAQVTPRFILPGVDVQKRVNGVLSLMQYALVPDVTTSSLSINEAASGDPGLRFTQFGGGFTVSQSMPLYLEGNASYTRYDPTFVATSGSEQRAIPFKWNSVAATGGIGWDFPIAPDWKFRPIFNFTIGHVESDASIAASIIEDKTGRELSFLTGGRMKAIGYGGSLMIDWERYRTDYEIDLEIRYSHIKLESVDSTSTGVEGKALARSMGVWGRWRAPTGKTVFDRPLRYVLEVAGSNYYGDTGDALGFDRLLSLGAGIEFDTSKYDMIVARTRFVLRRLTGRDVQGVSLGIAVSF